MNEEHADVLHWQTGGGVQVPVGFSNRLMARVRADSEYSLTPPLPSSPSALFGESDRSGGARKSIPWQRVLAGTRWAALLVGGSVGILQSGGYALGLWMATATG